MYHPYDWPSVRCINVPSYQALPLLRAWCRVWKVMSALQGCKGLPHGFTEPPIMNICHMYSGSAATTLDTDHGRIDLSVHVSIRYLVSFVTLEG